ncbi:hypothetical protein BHE74_00047654 [Ensete ventricosum]|nr:hypothetical protein BHE74_00047654 [Ensete ventricosum]
MGGGGASSLSLIMPTKRLGRRAGLSPHAHASEPVYRHWRESEFDSFPVLARARLLNATRHFSVGPKRVNACARICRYPSQALHRDRLGFSYFPLAINRDAMEDLAAAKHTSELIKTVREMDFRRGEMLLAIVVALCWGAIGTEAQLSVGFYSYSCPKAEVIVKKELKKALKADAGIGADLLRMHFHDCFGCDGSILLDSTKKNSAEKDAIPNQTLEDEAFQVIDKAKKKLEKVCKGTVSCADILAFAARDSVVHVTLYNFSRTASTDPTLNTKYAAQLKKECPPGSNNEVDMDPPSPLTFDTSYYSNLLDNRGLFTSDQILMSTPATAGKVRQFASNSVLFKHKFAAAMVKMGKIGVLTGKQGEIRRYCREVN